MDDLSVQLRFKRLVTKKYLPKHSLKVMAQCTEHLQLNRPGD